MRLGFPLVVVVSVFKIALASLFGLWVCFSFMESLILAQDERWRRA